MSTPGAPGGRLRACAEVLAAVVYFFLARAMAHQAALVLAGGAMPSLGSPVAEQFMLAALLLMGYAAMGFWFDRQTHPFNAQGLPRRNGFVREWGMGLATGWGLTVLCVLPMVVLGGIAVSFSVDSASWEWLAADAVFFALVALVEEVAFRGYGFQSLVRALGPVGATLGFAAYYALVQSMLFGSSGASTPVSIALALVLAIAYLRTRALWLSWGLNFGWKASQALVFGLAVSGDSSHSPVVQGNPMGPFWVTGGGFGLDATWVTFLLLLAAIPVIFKLTRDLDFHHNAPELVPGGMPVDLDAAARAQHEAAMGHAEPAAPALVQIAAAPQPGASAGHDPGPDHSA
jgi:uncharacterized protein